ncbi:hypothetical protein SAMN05216178_3247 [Pseudomonas saponiphila]|uniref:Uncharacterized protein n=1 Tax=Pseudomonas saponiphila TaxID=556534 RepID=A0A1H4PBY8_9PSED|nr:hypothetical protein SAMN05216178_3247 [Pseudomonas saponiphila]
MQRLSGPFRWQASSYSHLPGAKPLGQSRLHLPQRRA